MDTLKLPAALLAFFELFNSGEFFESHEVLEGAWLQNDSDFYQGLIIYAAAYVKRNRGNPRGVVLNFNKALNYLRPYKPSYLGLDVAWLVQHAQQCVQALGPLADRRTVPANVELMELVPTVTLKPRAEHLHGTEAELT